ncbi:DUF4156 domain-containing protein [Pseudomarimonas salicorniae]|uniref:DUF4156 domain-containing protein n=1 Tax=Pseudomarimonas salicorniae TaxID=2933270 RepID=A0ABT0GD37_9GAMM|nr:DUF4156 domain-containing protein [Lysobacter sp. CAU 1642]MCK7592348.1 DUF4156 domain-containing protein [Lysobacter sp. CAU 1642]
MTASRLLLVLAAGATLGACTWVKMEPQGHSIRVARASENLSACQRLGEITVTVKDQVGLYRRDPIKVKDELEVMARNEAPDMQADTIRAVDEPVNGEQSWQAFRCGAGRSAAPAQASRAAPAERPPAGDAETFPVRGD